METPKVDEALRSLVQMAMREDMGSGDRTVALAIAAEARGVGKIVARKEGVIAGTFLIGEILAQYAGDVDVEVVIADGVRAAAGQTVAVLTGAVGKILSAERVILNFLGRMSGVATLTAKFVDAVRGATGGHGPAVCDTRKTIPGWRALDKYAVRCGGGVNHRMGLYDGVMLKDNHLAALREKLGAGLTLAELTARVRAALEPGILLWLEVDTLEQLREALAGSGGADIVLLDNFSVGQMRAAVAMRKEMGVGSKVLLEASGGVTLENIGEMARTGVDRFSIGALTHSAAVLDLSMEFE